MMLEVEVGGTRWQVETYEDRFLHRNLANPLANIAGLTKDGGP